MTSVTAEDITVVILAGGMGRRMGGQDKGLVEFQGKSLIRHVVDAIRLQSSQILINANRNIEQYRAMGYPVVEDSLSGFQGPLAGFLAALQTISTSYLLTLPCDGPFVHPE